MRRILINLFGGNNEGLQIYNIIVSVILFVTVLFANFAESVAEGRGKAQAASPKKTQKDTEAHILDENESLHTVSSSELRKGDIVLVKAGEIIPGDGEVIEGIASVDESTIFDSFSNEGCQISPHVFRKMLARNMLIYGLGGVITPFIGIKLIDLIISPILLMIGL